MLPAFTTVLIFENRHLIEFKFCVKWKPALSLEQKRCERTWIMYTHVRKNQPTVSFPVSFVFLLYWPPSCLLHQCPLRPILQPLSPIASLSHRLSIHPGLNVDWTPVACGRLYGLSGGPHVLVAGEIEETYSAKRYVAQRLMGLN